MIRSLGPVTSRNALLLAILLLAFGLRLRGISFGLPALYDADEPIFALSGLKLLRQQTLNPGWFGHPGTTTIYALALVDLAVFGAGLLTGRFDNAADFGRAIYADPATLMLPGRLFILFCGLLCVVLTYRLGRRLFGPAVGLLAALLLAIDPVHIKYSQIIRTDTHASVFMLLCLLACVGIARRGRMADFSWAGIWLGLACATKWPSACVAVAIAGAALHRALAMPEQRVVLLRRLAATPVIAALALITASPFLVIDFPTLMANLQGEARTHHPGATGHGLWSNMWWYIRHPLADALALPGLVLATLGAAIAARRNRIFTVTIFAVAVVMLLAISAQALIWERWVVPLLPLLSIAAAVAIVATARLATGIVRRSIAGILIVIAVVPMMSGVEAGATERANDTRALASAWAIDHVPTGSTVLVETLAFDLFGHGWRFLFPVGDAGCVDVAASLRAKIPYATVERWRAGRSVINLGTIAPSRFASCRADYAILQDYDRYLLEAATYPGEIALYRRLIGQGRIVATFRPLAGVTGGPVMRVVRLDRDRRGWQ